MRHSRTRRRRAALRSPAGAQEPSPGREPWDRRTSPLPRAPLPAARGEGHGGGVTVNPRFALWANFCGSCGAGGCCRPAAFCGGCGQQRERDGLLVPGQGGNRAGETRSGCNGSPTTDHCAQKSPPRLRTSTEIRITTTAAVSTLRVPGEVAFHSPVRMPRKFEERMIEAPSSA